MEQILQIFILIPLIGFLITLFFDNTQEKAISLVAISALGIQLVGILAFFGYWVSKGGESFFFDGYNVYESGNFKFDIAFFYDKSSAVYSLVASVLMLLVIIFSKYYMHREPGFKRFFSTTLFFYTGLNVLILSGNFETLFMGWEILGITSFLLISFYRDRYLPVKNSMKVISIYRIGDIGLLLAVWFCHQLFHENISFVTFENASYILEEVSGQTKLAILISALLILAASVKSAQFPFSSWLPRAMEGPTTSSAIFYGSLSVHIGAFLLLRTSAIWFGIIPMRILVASIGVVTAVIAALIARVQPTAKTQIAYSSIAQIGVMFVEIALGFHYLALFHFAANAFLRTYQLLVSPSILSYLIHDQFFNFDQSKKNTSGSSSFWSTIYILSIKEWNLDIFHFEYLWSPIKYLGKQLQILNTKYILILASLIFAVGITLPFFYDSIAFINFDYLSTFYSLIALILILMAFADRGAATHSWLLIFVSQLFFMLSVFSNENFDIMQLLIYLSGTLGAAVVGYLCLLKVKSIENDIDLDRFHGHIYEHPKFGLLFLLCSLTMVGFPISPTYLGVDLLFSNIHLDKLILLIMSSLTFLILEISVIRIYARVFLGQHVKPYHEIAYKSS